MAEQLDLMTLQSALAQQQLAPIARAGGAQLGPFGLPMMAPQAPMGGSTPAPQGASPTKQKRRHKVDVLGYQVEPKVFRSMLEKMTVGPQGVPLHNSEPAFVQLADLPQDHPFRARMEALMTERKLAIHGLNLDALDKKERALAEHLFGPAIQNMIERNKRAEASAAEEIAREQAAGRR